MVDNDTHGIVQPQEMQVADRRRSLTIGLPACTSAHERRFPLTPEGAGLLVDAGFSVKIEKDAATAIHYTDTQYISAGAEVTSRDSALACDIVLHLPPITSTDSRRLKRGALLLTLLNDTCQDAEAVKELLKRHVTTIAIDKITDKNGHTPFADILAEIDGRAAMALCSSLLARPDHGKGILLGGVAGIIPCEVTIIGSGIAACAAALSATGLGAMVRMLDNDIYRLREAQRVTGAGVVTSAIHPHVLENALRSADVVLATEVSPRYTIGSDLVDIMKKGVIIMDLNYDSAPMFPSLEIVDISDIGQKRRNSRVCYTGIGNAVPRTAAMALSNTLMPLMRRIADCESATDTVRLIPEVRNAVMTFMGKTVNRRVAKLAGLRHIDINLLLNCC
ncbi:MAG: hypothetical protein J6B03_09525 [Candidatus Homeothermus sp.]|nr:hypothetical protein [Candidatus Homeothermus sp.]